MTNENQTEIAYTAESGIDIETARQAQPFVEWLAGVDRERFCIKGIHFQSLDMFGKRVGFIKFKTDVVRPSGKPLSGIVFMRGGSVGILLVLECEGKKYAVLTAQSRLPTGDYEFLEIPAGMLDGSGDFAGIAAKELEEELGFKIQAEELIDMTELAGHKQGLYLSPGASEETMRLFYLEKHVTRKIMEGMKGRLGGALDENEEITLQIVPLKKVWKLPDAKSVVAYALYQKLKRKFKQTKKSKTANAV